VKTIELAEGQANARTGSNRMEDEEGLAAGLRQAVGGEF
jgi:hypothetical protein